MWYSTITIRMIISSIKQSLYWILISTISQNTKAHLFKFLSVKYDISIFIYDIVYISDILFNNFFYFTFCICFILAYINRVYLIKKSPLFNFESLLFHLKRKLWVISHFDNIDDNIRVCQILWDECMVFLHFLKLTRLASIV